MVAAVLNEDDTPLAARLQAVYGSVGERDAFTGMVAPQPFALASGRGRQQQRSTNCSSWSRLRHSNVAWVKPAYSLINESPMSHDETGSGLSQ